MATEFKLVASDTNEFGRAVALSGDYAIVGAREKSGFPGSAYVFVKNGTGWAKQAKLSGSVKQETDDFGLPSRSKATTRLLEHGIPSALSTAEPMFSIGKGQTGWRRAYLCPLILWPIGITFGPSLSAEIGP
jgi:hypothetical protein